MTSNIPSAEEVNELDREILIGEAKIQLNEQEKSLMVARLQIKKAERATQKYRDTINALEEAIANSKAQIADLEKGGEYK
jgi:hypothetical protein